MSVKYTPPAFPVLKRGRNGLDCTDTGMSLRDWFAGQALAGVASNPEGGFFIDTNGDIAPQLARICYDLADCMLNMRLAGPEKLQAMCNPGHPNPEDMYAAECEREAALERDAARYRWLRERCGYLAEEYQDSGPRLERLYEMGAEEGWAVDADSLDVAVDAARKGARNG